MAFNKYEACEDLETGADCPDRKLGCHDTCKGYQFRHEKNMERLRKEKETRWHPTAHREKIISNYYRQERKRKMYKR
jgi:hypothetical protein